MSAFMFGLAAANVWTAGINWGSDNIKGCLVRSSAVGLAITGATNATPIVITSTAHGLTNGMRVLILGVGGNTAANRVAKVANVATNTFELVDEYTGANIAGNGAYTSGGRIIPLDSTTLEFLNQLGTVVATSSNLASKTSALGVLDAADYTFTSVAAGALCDLIFTYKDTGVASTSRLILVHEVSVTPDGNNVSVTLNANGLWRSLG